MNKKRWLIIAVAVLCLVVLGVTIWCVVDGVKGVLPQTEPAQTETEQQQPPVSQDEIVPIDPLTGAPVVEDNTVIDPWGEIETEDPIGSTPIEELPTEENVKETAEETKEEIDMEDWATSDEGWTGIY